MAQLEPTFLWCFLHRQGASPHALLCTCLCFFLNNHFVSSADSFDKDFWLQALHCPSIIRIFSWLCWPGSHAVCPWCERAFATSRPFLLAFQFLKLVLQNRGLIISFATQFFGRLAHNDSPVVPSTSTNPVAHNES